MGCLLREAHWRESPGRAAAVPRCRIPATRLDCDDGPVPWPSAGNCGGAEWQVRNLAGRNTYDKELSVGFDRARRRWGNPERACHFGSNVNIVADDRLAYSSPTRPAGRRSNLRKSRKSKDPEKGIRPRDSFLHSERDHRDAGNSLEVAHIAGGHAVAKFQRRDPDQQVGERQSDAPGRALTVDLPSPESYGCRHRMHGQQRPSVRG